MPLRSPNSEERPAKIPVPFIPIPLPTFHPLDGPVSERTLWSVVYNPSKTAASAPPRSLSGRFFPEDLRGRRPSSSSRCGFGSGVRVFGRVSDRR